MRNTLPLSSFPLHLLLHFEHYYTLLLSAFLFAVVLFKTYNLPYTSAMAAQEGAILAFFIIYCRLRVRYGLKANQTQNSTKMALFLLLTLLALILGAYYIFLQYYVLLVEVIAFAIEIVINGLEIILGFFACWQFQSYEKQQ